MDDLAPAEVEAFYTWTRDVARSLCSECGEPTGFCYLLCSHSPHYYSLEQERADSDYMDSLTHGEWFSLAVRQYEQATGESYCS